MPSVYEVAVAENRALPPFPIMMEPVTWVPAPADVAVVTAHVTARVEPEGTGLAEPDGAVAPP